MRKTLFRLWMLALPMLMGLASCTDNSDNPVSYDGVETEQTPDETLPTDDQMSVLVTADLPTAVLRPFDEGTTGAALVKRLSTVTNEITPETRMVLLRGDLFNLENSTPTQEEMMAIGRLYLNGGYVAIGQQTREQVGVFGLLFLSAVLSLEQADLEELFDIDETAAARAAQHSEAVERLKVRQRNLQAAATRADGGGLDDLFAELTILGPTDYFMQDALPDEATAYVHSADDEGNETAPEAVTTKIERTPFVNGQLADAAAEWLNSVEKEQAAAARRAVTRASGSSAINEMMDASETFTYSGAIDWRREDNATSHYTNRVLTTVRSWGIHNMESNKDYYYVKQNVTLRMGNDNGWKIFYPTSGENYWYEALNYGDYNRWYGSFLSQYETSMNLTGSGNIFLEASVPNTDNNSQTTNITVGSSTSHTVTNGISWSVSGGANATGPMGSISIGGSHTEGTTTGTSFSMSMSQTHKDFGVKKNTSGNKVTWTYNGALPKYYENVGSTIYYCHQSPADILVNDCDVADEICWSVSNPSGTYTVNVTSAPQTAVLLYVYKKQKGYKNAPHKYEYTTTPTVTYTHTLIEPNRATQNWRMYITIDILQSYAKSWGIKKFTIHWRCDDLKVTTREGFTVTTD